MGCGCKGNQTVQTVQAPPPPPPAPEQPTNGVPTVQPTQGS